MAPPGRTELDREAVVPFSIGRFRCFALRDRPQTRRQHVFSGTALIGDAPAETVAEWTPGPRVDAHAACLLVLAGRRHVVIEAGVGEHEEIPGALLAQLAQLGVAPERIDLVILSHVHPGHSGGVRDRLGRPTFPNARYVLAREEWEFWSAAPDLRSRGLHHLTTAAVACLESLRGRVELVERGAQIVPGITCVSAPGHTAGHMALSISSSGHELLALADTVLAPAHLRHPRWYSPYDLRPEQSVATRLRLLDRAAATRPLVHCFHFPFPGLGFIAQDGDAWQWEPLGADPSPRVVPRSLL